MVSERGLVRVNTVAQTSRGAALSGVHESTGAEGFGVFLLMVFLYLAYSRLTDLLLPSLYLPLIFSLLALLIAVGTGGLQRAFGSRAGFWLSALCVWLILAAPFSFWRGGTAHFLWEIWLKSFLVFVLVAGLLRTIRHCRLAMASISLATVTIAIMCFFIGARSSEGRLVLPSGVLTNPNDLAQLLLIGVPFLLLVVMSNGFFLKRALAGFSLLAVLVAIGATSSRGALAAFAGMTLLTFLNFSWSNKLKLVGALVVAIPLVLTLMSDEQRQRYLTLFAGETVQDSGSALDEAAIGSTAARMSLLRESIDMTISHPVVGVGPGVFQAASAAEAGAQGDDVKWRESHNAYTQISSEAGVPALIFYVAVLFVSLRNTRAMYKAGRQRGVTEIANVAYCLWLSLISFAITAFFSSVAYLIYLPTLAGLSVALGRAVQTELEAMAAAAPPPDTARTISAATPFAVRPRPPAAI